MHASPIVDHIGTAKEAHLKVGHTLSPPPSLRVRLEVLAPCYGANVSSGPIPTLYHFSLLTTAPVSLVSSPPHTWCHRTLQQIHRTLHDARAFNAPWHQRHVSLGTVADAVCCAASAVATSVRGSPFSDHL
jgi:DUF1365 family protein